MYLDDIASEFLSTHKPNDYRRGDLRPYAFNEFDTFVQRSKKSYENPRASNNLDKVNAQLKETTQIMSKNLEDLLYRGDSLDKMSSMSSDLRESSKKYKRAAVRINWQLLLQQVSTTTQIASAAQESRRMVCTDADNLAVRPHSGTDHLRRLHYGLHDP